MLNAETPLLRNYLVESLECLKLFYFFIVAIAEVCRKEGNDEYNKRNFNNAIHFYTEGIKVNCKDEELNAKLYIRDLTKLRRRLQGERQKNNRFNEQNNNSARASRFFVHFFAVPAQQRREMTTL